MADADEVAAAALGRLHALVVDDDPVDRALFSVMLKRGPHDVVVTQAEGIAAAVSAITASPPDCVLLDLEVPDATGLSGLEAIRAAAPASAVVVLTGTESTELAAEALAAGAQDYLVKPRADQNALTSGIRHAVERQRIQNRLSVSEERFRSAFQDAPIGMALLPERGVTTQVLAANHALAVLLGMPREQILARPFADHVLAEDLPLAEGIAGTTGQVSTQEFRIVRRDGDKRWVRATASQVRAQDGGDSEILMQVEDVTERRQAQRQIADYAFVDALTGLPNRLLALDRIRHALARGTRSGRSVCVMFLDVDNFKVVNDSLGHSAGDELLQAIGARLGGAVRPEDTAARVGGDEFVLCCDDLPPELGAAEIEAVSIADRVRAQLERPVSIDGKDIAVTVSIGIALAKDRSCTAEHLIRDADTALYRAKDKGRARWEIFDEALRAEAVGRLDTERALRQALEDVSLAVVYQPVVDLDRRRVVGAEALVRWRHPSGVMISPDSFIGVAEETGLIVPMGRWVLEQACRTLALWNGPTGDRTMAINISAKQLLRSDLAATVAEMCDRYGLKPELLTLEVTERQLVDLVGSGLTELNNLAEYGARLALDDFGTGYGSMTYLRNLPVSTVKIDRSFVSGMHSSAVDRAIVESVVNLGTCLDLDVVAEGVEDEKTSARLQELGCPHAQGWLYSHPVSAEALTGRQVVPTPR